MFNESRKNRSFAIGAESMAEPFGAQGFFLSISLDLVLSQFHIHTPKWKYMRAGMHECSARASICVCVPINQMTPMGKGSTK